MKNKKLLLFLLTAISVSAIGAVGCKNKPADDDNDHEHSYTWQSNADGHWQKCECDETTTVESHVDVKNNDSGENGKDGKCDVCDYEIKQSVTFNVQGHGTAPDAQYVSFGAKATKPADPVDDEYNFLGWYKDAACTTAFDFNDAITDTTVIYAKWVEDSTPGASVKYAYELELNKANLHALSAKGYSFYKYTATESGRYQVDLGLGNSQKCYFTTDKDGADVYYGSGYTAATKYFDLKKGESIVIKLLGTKDLAASAEVSVTVNVTSNEPLPADGWFDGLFTNGSGSDFELNRKDNKILLYYSAYSFNYIGGSVDTLTFTQDMGLGDEYITTFSFKRNVNGTFTVTSKGSNSLNANYICIPKLDESLIVGKFSGVYTPADGNEAEKITKVLINADGTGSYVQNGNTVQQEYVNYDENYGMLTYGQYVITPNFVDGVPVSINIFSSTFDDVVVYERTGDVMPNVLPLARTDEYIGENYSVVNDYGQQYFVGQNRSTFEITAYDKASNTYTIDVDGESFKLVFEGEGNNALIKLYDASDSLLDTLVYYFVNYVDLPTTGSVTAPLADFKKDFYHFEAKETGWYQFTNSDADIEIYYGLSKENPVNEYSATLVDTNKVYLREGTVVGLKNLNPDKTGNFTFTVSKVEADQGFAETDPIELNGTGTVSVPQLTSDNKLYVKFTPSAAGSYLICVSCDGMFAGWTSYNIYYNVGGTAAGFSYEDYKWYGGLDSDNVNFELTVSDTTPVMIVVGDEFAQDFSNVTVTVTNDYRVGATDLGEFVLGTPVAGEVPASVTVSAAGTYRVADTYESNLTLTSSSAFTAKCNGIDVDVTNEDGTYTATIMAGTELYVEVSAAVTFTVTYLEGSAQCPVNINLSGISFSHEVSAEITYFTFTQAGNFAAYANERFCYFSLNDERIGAYKSFEAAVGDVLKVEQYYDVGLTVTVKQALPEDVLGEYKNTDDVHVYVGAISISIGDDDYDLTAVSGNTYTYTAADSSTATLVISGETLTLDGQALTSLVVKPIFTKNQAGTYNCNTGTVMSLTFNTNGVGVYTFDTREHNEFDVTITEGESGSYSFVYNYQGSDCTVTFTFDNDGNIVLTDANVQSNATFVKEAPAVEGTLYSGSYETMGGSNAEMELILSDDLTSGTLSMNDPYDEYGESNNVAITLTPTGDNTYSFTDAAEYRTVSITIDGDTVSISIENSTIVGVELNKQS